MNCALQTSAMQASATRRSLEMAKHIHQQGWRRKDCHRSHMLHYAEVVHCKRRRLGDRLHDQVAVDWKRFPPLLMGGSRQGVEEVLDSVDRVEHSNFVGARRAVMEGLTAFSERYGIECDSYFEVGCLQADHMDSYTRMAWVEEG